MHGYLAGHVADGIEILPLVVPQLREQGAEARYARTLGIRRRDANRKVESSEGTTNARHQSAGPVQHSRIYNNQFFIGEGCQVDFLLYSAWNGWAENARVENNIFDIQGSGRFYHPLSGDLAGAYTRVLGWGGN